MKILLLADFGGNFSANFLDHIKSIDFDFAIVAGDFADIKAIRELFLKYGDGYDEYYNKLTKKEKADIRRKRHSSARNVIEKLNSIGKPVYLVSGNNEIWGYETFVKMVSNYKNCRLIDGKRIVIKEVGLIGNRSEIPTQKEESVGKDDEWLYNYQEKILENNFRKLKIKNIILVNHYPPHGCKLDKLPKTNPLNPGKHIGSYLIRDFLGKRCPPLIVCGHLEEYQGSCVIGKTIVINPGEAGAGKYAILKTDTKNFNKSEIRFYK